MTTKPTTLEESAHLVDLIDGRLEAWGVVQADQQPELDALKARAERAEALLQECLHEDAVRERVDGSALHWYGYEGGPHDADCLGCRINALLDEVKP